MHELTIMIGLALTALAGLYAMIVSVAICWPRKAVAPLPQQLPPVTILKALCGAERGLYEQLRSFCTQRYPQVQIIFGVRDRDDPALEVVRQLRAEFPALDIELVVDATLHGSNRKISNLLNMLPRVRHELLVMADSDILVPEDYLRRIVPPLLDARVGLVTCPYLGRARSDIPALLGAMFINEWFMPAVRVAALFGSQNFVSGATIALRRETLAAIGGLGALADQLADDYRLGELVRRHGLRVVLADLLVYTAVEESSLRTLWGHELRWMRTIQSVQPLGYAFSLPTLGLAPAVIGAALAGFTTLAMGGLAITAAGRLVLHCYDRTAGARRWWAALALLPLRDLLLLLLWCWSFCSREVSWREHRYGIAEDGSLRRVS
jgi:ceramide glucosyltransferase